MHKIGFNFDLLAHGMQRGGGGAQRRFAVLDIQTLITQGFIWLAFGDRMDETKRDVAAGGLGDSPLRRIDGCVGAVDTHNDPLW